MTAQYVDVLSKCFALTAFVSDRDRILAASGAGRRDLADRSVSQPLEKLMDSRKPYQSDGSPEKALLPCEGSPRALLCAVPIIAAGMSPAVWACLRRTALPSPMPPSSRR